MTDGLAERQVTDVAGHRADLEPSLVSRRTYATRRRVGKVDAALVLCLVIVTIGLIPFNLIVPGMTDLGRPGIIVALGLFGWWFISRFTTHLSMRGPQPLRWALLFFMMSVLISYAVGFIRGLTTIEANGADRALLFFCALAGVILMTADGLPNWQRIRVVVNVLVFVATVMAIIGLMQYVFHLDVTQYIAIPGLQSKLDALGFMARGSSYRVASTTAHYIELATVLAFVLPYAVHVARFAERRRHRQLALLAAGVIAAGVGTTISRTGILAIGVMFLCLFPVWNWRMRFNVAVLSVIMLGVLAAVSPGLYRSIFAMFSDAGTDTSVSARYERYPMVFAYVGQHPWLGRGTGTWLPPQYQILDNQWLVTLLTNGVLGVVALATLHITGMVLAYRALKRATTDEYRHFSTVALSTQLMALLVAGTFDSLGFTTYAVIMALSLGFCGAAWRLTHPEPQIRTSTPRWFLGGAYRSEVTR
ncbi:MAG: O-antigen ligase family protein [Hamadaea sp.]|uniref:O-antigen ligase family protein n=1 Tax=Hamadaea sp. TaxID=2024425 RepID=UPI0018428C9F|nr:O-antigen ligase family protein [Hamadaea sp.]NUR70156.1 O-antigen ligase family protein [Hamadaea sp.]NUT23530.1 O-antigen ligase family protein [Hamadaea sp.]